MIGWESLLVVATSRQLDHSSSGADGAHACQAATTIVALFHGQRSVNNVSVLTGCAWKVNEVTTPKLPPPPPRSAQKRSGSWFALQVSRRPSATTTCAACKVSQVRPNLRPRTPTPPPMVRPATPTVAQEPAGSTRPCCASAA